MTQTLSVSMAGELVATEAAMPADSTQIAVQEEGGRTSKRLGLPPWAVLVLVAVLGCVDGGLRAVRTPSCPDRLK